jgi:hypothetical protein
MSRIPQPGAASARDRAVSDPRFGGVADHA